MNRHYPTAIGLLALMTLGGCASITDSCYEKTQTVRAFKEYIKCGKPECSSYPHDYKCGWIDGFYEVATGGECCPPAVAPARYYKPEQILKHCDNKRHAYYSGWQDGASRASQFPDTHYLRIYETCECPFPRCDKPCGDGTCGPCGVPFVGMSASEDMIEVLPIEQSYMGEIIHDAGMVPVNPSEELGVQSSSNREIPGTPELPLESGTVVAEEMPAPKKVSAPKEAPATKAAPSETKPEAVEPIKETAVEKPQGLPTPKADANTSYSAPLQFPSPSSSRTSEEKFSAYVNDGFALNPVVPTPITAAENISRSPEGKKVGFVRLVQPLQNATSAGNISSGNAALQVSPVTIVEAANATFEMLETESTAQSAR